MSKNAQFIEIVGIVIILGIAVVGTTSVYFIKETTYIADNSTMNIYKYSECKNIIKNLNPNTIKAYNSIERAQLDGYHLKGCN